MGSYGGQYHGLTPTMGSIECNRQGGAEGYNIGCGVRPEVSVWCDCDSPQECKEKCGKPKPPPPPPVSPTLFLFLFHCLLLPLPRSPALTFLASPFFCSLRPPLLIRSIPHALRPPVPPAALALSFSK
eukprot:3511135-Rhodomonas_salina.1